MEEKKKSPEENQLSPGEGVSGQNDHLFKKNETKSTKRSEKFLKNQLVLNKRNP